MNKFYLYLVLILVLTNCTLKNVEKHHGFHYLEKKSNKLLINATNKNDIIEILGPPSTKGSFDKDVWIYLELVEKKQSIFKLGKNIIDVNNILVLDLNSRGVLISKTFYNKDQMNDLKFSKNVTDRDYSRDSFVYSFLSSLRQKINDPLGKRKVGRK
tara:strand:- start:177 stop:647 length:471 start_codon:yes stop_codon:yes gene_type:complete